MRMTDSLSDVLPDLVVLVKRDGVILSHMGGRGVATLALPPEAVGRRLDTIWPESIATCIRQTVRRAIAQRTTLDTFFTAADVRYELRTTAQGPGRALCVIRAAGTGSTTDEAAGPDELTQSRFDRRGFLNRFHDTLSEAVIQEKPAALALIHLDGIADIERAFDAKISEQVLSSAILRLPHEVSRPQKNDNELGEYLGQLSADILALVMASADRDAIETCVSRVCASLGEPVPIGDATFQLTPYAGVSILGQDGSSPRSLLDKARSACAEARRSNSSRVFFFSDTLKLRSLQRLDIAREMRDAIANREIALRYSGRHELASGRLVAHVGYLKWTHPLRGELTPGEFLGVAETTGLAPALSRALLAGLRDDFTALRATLPPDVRVSFGALRHHLLQDDFVDDIGRFLAESGMPASRLELRIAERTFASMNASICQSLGSFGIQIVVDEVGRGFASSLDRLARAPIWGLQLDRAWTTALRTDEVALKVCKAGISAAGALGLTPIATGVDDAAQREALVALGCRHGSGDLFGPSAEFDTAIMRPASHRMT
jgi:EAL domain-containing protein (putative c-di-GMP-specific phosphodiesterase class I)/GGDEF domain-containing protein